MASLSSNQVDKIYDLLVDHKITLESLQIDLLDHIVLHGGTKNG